MAATAFTPPGAWGAEPVKSTRARAPLDVKSHGDRKGAISVAVVLDGVGASVLTVGNATEARPNQAVGVGGERVHGLERLGNAAFGRDFEKPGPPGMEGRQLSVEIPAPLVGGSDVREHQPPKILVALSGRIESDRGNSHTLLDDLSGERHRSRGHPADVGVVGPGSHIAQEGVTLPVDALNQRDIRKMGASAEGVVHHGHIPRSERPQLRESGFDAHRHGSEMYGHVVPEGYRAPLGIEESTGIVPSFLDVRRKGRPPQGRPHLLGEGGEQVPEDLECDWIEVVLVRGCRHCSSAHPICPSGVHCANFYVLPASERARSAAPRSSCLQTCSDASGVRAT